MNKEDANKDANTDAAAASSDNSPEREPSAKDLALASTVTSKPDYEILRRIGHGAYGEVFLARDSNGSYRAVKVIFRESFEHERPFEREYEGICKFERVSRSYDNQVQIFHVGRREEPRQFYYIMELADDQATGQDIHPETYQPKTLRSELKSRGRLPVKQCVSIGMALARALENLHESGLIHRDIKPANIIFVNGRPKLADIGLVTDRDMSVSFVGTEGFIPPEGPSSAQADIYSLGKVLYEMCTGRDRMDYPELPTDLPELPDREMFLELNDVIRTACQNHPDQRYPSAARLLADLKRLYGGQSLRKRRRLKRQLATVGVAAGTTLLAAGAIALWRGVRTDREKSLPQSGGLAPPAGLIAWWPGDADADDIVGNQNGVPINGADYGPGLIGQAFRVNGSKQYFSIPHTPSLSFTNGQPFTLEAWVYRTGGSVPFHVLGKRDTDSGCWYQLGYDYSSPRVPLNTWTHLVTAQDGTNAISYYNGVPVTSTRARCPGPNPADFQIGSSHTSGFFKGLLDDVRVYNRALKPVEIKTIYDAASNGIARPPATRVQTKAPGTPGAPRIPTRLIAWWPGNDNALDSAGSHNGTLMKGAAFGMGKIGQAFSLNGRAYVQVPNSPLWSFGSDAFTIELWAKFASASGGQTLVACDDGSGNHNKWIFWFNHGGIGLHVNRPDLGGLDFGHAPFVPTLNQWHHLAVTRRSTQYVFFIDGTAVSTNTDSHEMPPVAATLTIGSAEGGNFFNGSIDEVRIYNRALDPSEVAAIYAESRKEGVKHEHR